MRGGGLIRWSGHKGLWISTLMLLFFAVLGQVLVTGLFWPVFIYSLLLLAAASLIQLFVWEFRLTDNRGYYPFSFFVLMGVAYLPHFMDWKSLLSVFLFILSLFRLYAYSNPGVGKRILFESSFLLGLSALWMPRMALMLPVFWMVASIFESVKWREWFGSIIGFSAVLWMYYGLSWFLDLDAHTQYLLSAFNTFSIWLWTDLGWSERILAFPIIFTTLFSIVSMIKRWQKENLIQRKRLSSIMVLLLGYSLNYVLMPAGMTCYFMAWMSLSSIVFAQWFSTTDHILSRVSFALLWLSALIVYLVLRFACS